MWRRVLVMGLILAAVGCGTQQIAPANRRALQALQTAVSSKKVDWLNEVVKLIDGQVEKGEMSEEEYAVFEPIIVKARAGDWASAQRDVFALSEAQKPTAEDLEKIKPQGRK